MIPRQRQLLAPLTLVGIILGITFVLRLAGLIRDEDVVSFVGWAVGGAIVLSVAIIVERRIRKR
jgi:uncharacterized membrane protein YjfL (UPF0719 family)